MDNITLNEQQMKLLQEYKEAIKAFRKANEYYNNTDIMSEEFTRATNLYRQAFVNRDRTACVFAASVLVDLKGEVSHA